MSGRGDHALERLLDESRLPHAIRRRIGQVVSAAALLRSERIDVARELIAHFEDGLAAGHSEQELLAAFGDGGSASSLIARGKRAARPHARAPLAWLPELARDLRYGARRLLQSPGFTIVALVSLALGIGANTAIFSVVDTLLLDELPVRDPDRLVNVYESDQDFPFNVLSYPDLVDLREASGAVFEDVGASKLSMAPLERGDEVESVMLELVSPSYFAVLGLEPEIGRLIGPDDNVAPGAHPVVVLSYASWQREFAGDPAVVGREIRLAGAPYTVIGVIGPDYKGNVVGVPPEMYVPVMMLDQIEGLEGGGLEIRRNYSYFGRARLREGATVEQAREAAEAIAVELRAAYPDAWTSDREFLLVPARDVVIFPQFDGPLRLGSWLLLGVVGLVLFIACANLASFLLARAVDRRREIAVRLSLGAGRGRLVRQLLTEALLLAALGGLAGVLLAHWMLTLLENADLPLPLPMTLEFAIDGSVLAFAIGVSLLAGLMFGLLPALQATRADMATTLRDESAGAGGGGGRARMRNLLVTGQVAVSVVLLVSAGLFLRSLGELMEIDPGFGDTHAGIVQISLPADRFPGSAAVETLEGIEGRLAADPAITHVGTATNLALDSTNNLGLRIAVDGVEPPPGQDFHDTERATITPGYLEAIGIRLLRGRTFEAGDDAEGQPVAIVNDALVRRFWPGDSGLGRTFRTERGTELTVVGVTTDTRMRALREDPRMIVYTPLRQQPSRFGYLVAAGPASADDNLRTLLTTLRREAPDATLFSTRTIDEHLQQARFPSLMAAWLFGAFAALALLLAAIGLYGTVSYSQSQRVREVGIRMSLGADAGSVVRLLLRGGLRLVAAGALAGVVTAVAAARLLAGLLYGVSPWDPTTFGVVLLALLVVAVTASWIPARRATRIDPVEALRSE